MQTDSEVSRFFSSATKWQPRNSMLLLKPTVEPEKSEGGIIIPDTVRRKAQSGYIQFKGPNADSDLNVGDEVFFEQHQEFRIILDDTKDEAILISDSHILLRNPYTPVVTSQEKTQYPYVPPMTVDVAKYLGIDTGRVPGETDEAYNNRMTAVSPDGFYWNSLTHNFEKHPDNAN